MRLSIYNATKIVGGALTFDLWVMATPLKPWELRGRGGGPESGARRDGQIGPRSGAGGPSPPPAVPPRPANAVGQLTRHR